MIITFDFHTGITMKVLYKDKKIMNDYTYSSIFSSVLCVVVMIIMIANKELVGLFLLGPGCIVFSYNGIITISEAIQNKRKVKKIMEIDIDQLVFYERNRKIVIRFDDINEVIQYDNNIIKIRVCTENIVGRLNIVVNMFKAPISPLEEYYSFVFLGCENDKNTLIKEILNHRIPITRNKKLTKQEYIFSRGLCLFVFSGIICLILILLKIPTILLTILFLIMIGITIVDSKMNRSKFYTEKLDLYLSMKIIILSLMQGIYIAIPVSIPNREVIVTQNTPTSIQTYLLIFIISILVFILCMPNQSVVSKIVKKSGKF